MALKVKAIEKLQKIGSYAGNYRYVMSPELYSTLDQNKVKRVTNESGTVEEGGDNGDSDDVYVPTGGGDAG